MNRPTISTRDTLDLLEEMVAEYSGTLLLVSHDRAFLDNVVTSTLVFEGGGRVNEYVAATRTGCGSDRSIAVARTAGARPPVRRPAVRRPPVGRPPNLASCRTRNSANSKRCPA